MPSDATVLKVASGQEQTGADLQLRLVRTVTVSGTVSGADGPVRNTGVRLIADQCDGRHERFGSRNGHDRD